MRKSALALTLVAAVACGGAGTGATTNSPANGGGALATANASAGSPSARPFRDLAEAFSANPYKVTYRVSSTAGSQAVSGTQTWYVSGQRFRMDLAATQGAQAGSFSIFVIPEGTYSCVSGRGAPAAQCFGVGGAQAYAQSPGASFDAAIRANPDSFGATFSGTRTIAGTSASCYGLSGTSAGFTTGTVCYAASGVPLLYQFDASGLSFTMEATSFSVPTDADFTLPAPAQQFPSVPLPSPNPSRP